MSKKTGDIMSLLSKTSTTLKVTKPQRSKQSISSNIEITKLVVPQTDNKDNKTRVSKKSDTRKQDWIIEGSHLIKLIPINFDLSPLVFDSKIKVAAFDLDDTIIKTKSGSKFSRNPDDWQFFYNNVESSLISLIENSYLVVIFTNQGGIVANPSMKSYIQFVSKLNKIFEKFKREESNYHENMLLFASPKRPAGKNATNTSSETAHKFVRKPNVGMWEELKKTIVDKTDSTTQVNLAESFYVGDAAGRKGDFSDSDKLFAENVRLKFLTPEEFFRENEFQHSLKLQ